MSFHERLHEDQQVCARRMGPEAGSGQTRSSPTGVNSGGQLSPSKGEVLIYRLTAGGLCKDSPKCRHRGSVVPGRGPLMGHLVSKHLPKAEVKEEADGF